MGQLDGKVDFDASRWPLVVITQRVERVTDDERLASLVMTDSVLDTRTDRYAIVLDNRRAGPLSPTQRTMVAEYTQRTAERVRTRCVCNAMVVSTELMRMMITAIGWQTGKLTETQVFDQLDLALHWTWERLEAVAQKA